MLKTISLRQALPFVFADRADQMRGSEIWLCAAQFERGRYYMVEAESGAGKSSLCSFIYGQRRDYQGQILFDGADIATFGISRWCQLRRTALGLLPQEMRLFPELTVMENVQIKNRLTGHCTKQQILDMLEALEIAEKANTRASLLSIGQQQRVAIVRALCQPFSFLLLDEPVSHLDERNNRMAARLIVEHAAKQGAGIIATSVGNPLLIDQPCLSLKL